MDIEDLVRIALIAAAGIALGFGALWTITAIRRVLARLGQHAPKDR